MLLLGVLILPFAWWRGRGLRSMLRWFDDPPRRPARTLDWYRTGTGGVFGVWA